MPYDSLITRSDTDALVPEEVSNILLRNLENQSAVLSTFRRIPVATSQTRFPVISALPVAHWVNGDTGLKQSTKMAWANKYINIEEIAVYVAIPENVLDDSGYPIWEQVRPLCEQAAGRLLDETVFFGTDAPASFPDDIVTAAVAAGNVIARGTNAATAGGFVQDVGDLLTLVEADGYDPYSGIGKRTIRGHARKARNADGDRFAEVVIARDRVEIDGVEFTFPMRGEWPSGLSVAEAVMYDPSEFIVGVRQDFTWKLLDQAVIQDNTGAIIFNLPQQDMVAMRMKMRVGWQVANPINYDEATEANRYPAGVIRTPAS